MFSKTMQGLLISTFMVAAVPALAEGLLPGVIGKTTAGSAMVDAKGMALYTSDADVDGKSACIGDCAAAWIPMEVAADAVASGDWTIIVREDGTRMWAFKGQPVYTSASDTVAGEVNGDVKGGFHLAQIQAEAGASVDADGMMKIASMGKTAMGDAWIDANGMALYTFDLDVDGKSMCNGDCAAEWPPMKASADAVATGEWTIVARDDGSKMWAFKGKPLYTYVQDKAAGEVNGDNKNGFHLAM